MPFRRLGEPFRGLGRGLGAPRGGGLPTLTFGEIGGATGWWDASVPATLFTDAGVTPVSANGDLVYRMNDRSGGAGNRYMEQAVAASRMTYRTNRQNGLSGLESVSSDSMAVTIALSNFIANNEAFFFMVYKLNTTGGQILNDPSYYIGFQISAANTLTFQNWDGAYNPITISFTNNVPLVICGWHSGGNIYLQKNLESPVSAASGNTTLLTGFLTINRSSATLDFYEAGVGNQAVLQADREALIRGAINKWGITT